MDTETLYAPYANEKTRIFNERISKDDRYPYAGVTIPVLRRLARNLDPESIDIRYHEDVILKGLAIIGSSLPVEWKLERLDALLPFLSSWDHTDVIASSMKVRGEEKEKALQYFASLAESPCIFTRRLGIVFLLSHRKDYDSGKLLGIITKADSDDYYVSMAVAWALSFFYIDDKENAAPWFSRVSEKTRKRAWQKVHESKRIPKD